MTEIIEEKPTEVQQDLFMFPEASVLPPEMERSMAEAIDKMLQKEHAWATAELEQRDRVILKVLQNRSKTFPTIKIYDSWVQEYLELSVPYKRQRSTEMVKIFENAMQYIKISLKEKMQSAITKGI